MPFDKDDFIYIPTAKLWFAKERTHLLKGWPGTWKALLKKNLEMPTIEEFRVSLKYLRDSKEREHNSLYEEITQARFILKENCLDAYFKKRSDGIYLLTKNRTKAEKLQDCLMQNRTPGISLDDWLNSNASHGLPASRTKNGNLYFWTPVEKYVVGFGAGSDWACLRCYRHPDSSDASLGVRACAEGAVAKNRRR